MPGKILIVDDIATNRVILRVKLAAARYKVIEADCGESALEMARREGPSLILMDVSMPKLSGLEVCRALKADPATAHIPVVLFSAYPSASTKLKALASGAEEFMHKPFDEMALMARIRSLLRARHITQELSLRDGTSQALGLGMAEGAAEAPQPPGRITLLSYDVSVAEAWKDVLAPRMQDRLRLHDAALALRDGDRTDVFVLNGDTDPMSGESGLHMIPELRARTDVRHAAIVVVLSEGHRNNAAMALDLGATDIVIGDFEGEEMALRLATHLRRKRESDRLRKRIADGLQLAVTDPLTGLYNRRYAMSHLHRVRSTAHSSGRSFAVMMIDLDRFKMVNDTHGHAAGDVVLKTVAERLQNKMRSVDLLARIGGEEFLAVMPDCDADIATRVAERLRATVEENPITLGRGAGSVLQTISIGVVVVGQKHPADSPLLLCSDEADLLEKADRALYRSKATGRNSVTIGEAAA